MTNLKKTLAVVLAFAMILSMGAISTFAYTDVEAGTVVSEAVDILSNLDILTGFEDGTFRPDETVTRAQMAAIICRTLGFEDQAQSSMGSTVFNDVAADHWASGYVNVAQAQGIINGYGDGNFGPEDKVTYEQAVKMIVSALGYDLAAQAKGGYPTGYLAIASAEGITKHANGKVGDAAKRSAIAILVYNSLEVRLMDQSAWTTNNEDEYKKTDETVLSKYLEVTKWEGIVVNTPLSLTAANGTYDADATPKMQIFGKYFYYNGGKLIDKSYDGDGDGTVGEIPDDYKTVECDKVDVNAFLGKSVVAYIGEDDYTGNDTVFAISENDNKNDVKKISAEQLVESGQKYYNDTANTIGYTEVGSSKIKDLTIAAGATALVNYKVVGGITTTQALENQLKKGGVIELISNDADTDIEYIVATSYQREAVVEAVEEVNGAYKFDCYKGKLPVVDPEDDEALVVVYKDGALADAKAIAANDTVSYVEVADGLEILFVSSATVTGVVDSYDSTENLVTIGGVDYEISKVSGLSAQKLSGEEGTFFLNVDGQISHNETAPTAVGKYALVLATYDETTGINSGSYIQVALADGTIAEYEISDTAKVVDDSNGAVTAVDNANIVAESGAVDTAAEFKAYFAGQMNTNGSYAPVTGATWKAEAEDITAGSNLLVKLTVSNDKVTKARLLPAGSSAAGSTASKYEVESDSLGALNFDGSTVVFSLKETTGVIDPDNIKVGAVADFFVDDEDNYDVVAFDEDDASSVYGAVIGFGISKPISAEASVFVVSSKKTTTYDNNDAYVLTGMIAGEEKTVTVYNKDGYGAQDPSALVAGDVILISEPDAEGIVSDIEKLVDFAKGGSLTAAPTITTAYTAGVNALDQIYSGAGLVTDATSNKFVLGGDVKNDAAGHANQVTAGTGISYRSAANYTLVDYSENFKNPVVSYEDGSDYLFDEAYLTYAYVRYIDGKLADVVVYRLGEYAAIDVELPATATVNAAVSASYDAATTGVSVAYSGTNVTDNSDGTFKITAAGATSVTVTISKTGYVTVTKTVSVTAAS